MNTPQHIKSRRDFAPRRRWRDLFSRPNKPLEVRRLSYDQHSRKKQLRWLTQSIGNLIVVGLLIGFVGFSVLFLWTTKDLPDPNRLLDRNIQQTTTIYDRTGETILYQLHGDVNRKLITLAELPEYIKWATITAEDRDFYNHHGFSIRGIIRSFVTNLFSDSRVGGSTITQQFVKNAILSPEKTYTRKLKELILSYRIESKFSKDEILQLYFNEIPYGSVVYGIEAAAETFFGKSAKDLTVAQATVLAAIPQRPTYFSPYGENVDELLERQRYIINEMVDLGYLDEATAAAAKAEPIEFKPRSESMPAPHFVMHVRQLLADQYGERVAVESGLKVTTTLDLDDQKAAEAAVAAQREKNLAYNATNASLVSLDTKTGQILAMVGSADFNDESISGQVNVALRPRQPGSSFKPLAYVTAFAKGYTPETILYDVVTQFSTDSGQPYEPHNYNLKENGPVTMRKALAGSLNIPAVKTLYLAGVQHVLDIAEELGYTTFSDRSRFGLSLVLGGGEIKLLEHTAAYAAFAREGIYHTPLAILKIEDAEGEILYEYKDSDNRGKQVLTPEAFRSLNSILSDNAARAYIFGEKNYLTLSDRPVAAKTGTTNDYHDAWTLGYTPSIATGVWVGNSDNKEMKRGADGSVVAAPIWNAYMRAAVADQPVETFQEPPANTATKPVLRGEMSGAVPIKIDKVTGKRATEFTPPENVIEKYFTQFHCILYYVNKDDPQGPPPADPFADPQFAPWEDAVRRWATAQGFIQNEETPPSEFDDLHTPENQPTISIRSPHAGATINSSELNVQVDTSARRGVTKVEYLIDNQLIATVTATPFDLTTTLDELASGIHTLTARASDDVGNRAEQSIDLNFLLPQSNAPVKFGWLAPATATLAVTAADFPLTIKGSLAVNQKVERIDFITKDASGKDTMIGQLSQPNNTPTVVWATAPAAGSYTLSALIFQTNGKIIRSDERIITLQ